MWCVSIWDWSGSRRVEWRRQLIHGLGSIARRRGGELVAFGMGEDLRLVVTSVEPESFARAAAISLGRRGGSMSGHSVHSAPRLDAAVWAHQICAGAPLGQAWTSHRDVLGLRHAGWVAPWSCDGAERLHIAMKGAQLSRLCVPPTDAPMRSLAAAATLGRPVGHASTYSLVARLARACGVSVREAAEEANLTPRRVQQLAGQDIPLVRAGLTALCHPPLLVWPHPEVDPGPEESRRLQSDMRPVTEAHARAWHLGGRTTWGSTHRRGGPGTTATPH